jgi:drug/metabolite transporter (DMT)-like permease
LVLSTAIAPSISTFLGQKCKDSVAFRYGGITQKLNVVEQAYPSMRGELAALMAAFLWAVATVVFGRLGKALSPLVLNLAKGAIALVLLSLTLVLMGQSAAGLDRQAVSILALSGVIGIGLGDTAYFTAINHLGPRRALLLETLGPAPGGPAGPGVFAGGL